VAKLQGSASEGWEAEGGGGGGGGFIDKQRGGGRGGERSGEGKNGDEDGANVVVALREQHRSSAGDENRRRARERPRNDRASQSSPQYSPPHSPPYSPLHKGGRHTPPRSLPRQLHSLSSAHSEATAVTTADSQWGRLASLDGPGLQDLRSSVTR